MADKKVYTLEEVKANNNKKSCWLIIDNKVVDVTKFLSEHPGGEEVILEHAGTETTEAFNDVGHSSDAKKMVDDMIIGSVPADGSAKKAKAAAAAAATQKPLRAGLEQSGMNPLLYLAPLVILAAIVYSYVN